MKNKSKFPKEIEVVFEKSDFKKMNFNHNSFCPLAKAINRMFPNALRPAYVLTFAAHIKDEKGNSYNYKIVDRFEEEDAIYVRSRINRKDNKYLYVVTLRR